MTVSRRELVAGLGVVSAVAASSGVSACSPVPPSAYPEAPGKFFAQIAQRKLLEARASVANDVKLSLVTAESQELFVGPLDVIGAVNNLIHSKGLNMIGDSAENAPGGMYWRPVGPWMCSDMIKGRAVELGGGCLDDILQTVLNVYVSLSADDKLAQIMLLENRQLMLHENMERYREAF